MFYRWKTGDKPDFVGDHGCAGRKRDGTPKWVVPFEALAYAAAPGIIQLAGDTRTGARVWIDHGNGYRTGYFHLLETSVRLGSFIDVLDPVGEVGDNPNDHDGRHIHFELSPIGVYKPIDPEPFIHHGDYEDY
jgi:murein DD-endopeptidase MepM/ murein hydrolase activator NlpD